MTNSFDAQPHCELKYLSSTALHCILFFIVQKNIHLKYSLFFSDLNFFGYPFSNKHNKINILIIEEGKDQLLRHSCQYVDFRDIYWSMSSEKYKSNSLFLKS